ncbi:RxLR effector protein [Phytophthora megakarya]|uniref:RxLR effector protein n=1 Tax=Phytophthora megakarya TaxID=4795 RepID=A0A225WFW3_9STRA|nr:RxLR effector protein [Phytophthora megakarya]
MRKSLLLIVLVVIVLASTDARSAPDTRMLRATVGEERGIIVALGTRLKMWARSFKTWVKQILLGRGVAPVQDKRMVEVEWLVKKKAPEDVLFRHEVSPDEYFQALKLDPGLRTNAHKADLRENNPKLQKFFNYDGYFTYKKAVD